MRRRGGPLKRIYFLVAIAILQITAGLFMLLGAAQPVRMSPMSSSPPGTITISSLGFWGPDRWRKSFRTPGSVLHV